MSAIANVERAGMALRTLGHLADAVTEGAKLSPKGPPSGLAPATPTAAATVGGVAAVILGLGLIVGVPLAVMWSRAGRSAQ